MASTHVDTHTHTYSMSQIHSLIFHGHHTYTLPETVWQTIQMIEASIVVPPEATETATTTPSVRGTMTNAPSVATIGGTETRPRDRVSGATRERDPTRGTGGGQRSRPDRPDRPTYGDRRMDQRRAHGVGRAAAGGGSGGPEAASPTQQSWITPKPVFKATVIDTKQGIEKDMNDVRLLLNKLSNKKYDTQKAEILERIDTIFHTWNSKTPIEKEGSDADSSVAVAVEQGDAVKTIAQFIFDIASTNQFYSELYAGLYQDLVASHAVFGDVLDVFVANFRSTMDATPYCDPNTDYDGFCRHTKQNERRRATAAFFVMLVVREVLGVDRLVDIVTHLQDLMETAIREEGRANDVEEWSELLFLFVTIGADVLLLRGNRDRATIEAGYSAAIAPFPKDGGYGGKEETDILGRIQTMSQRKAKDFASLSSRAIFKHRDILDKI
jgi:hypothetical protein